MAGIWDRDRPTSAIPDGFAASPIPQQFAHSGSSASLDDVKPAYMHGTAFDRRLIKELLTDLTAHPDAAMEYLYARLFTAHPDLRGFFQHAMTQTRAAVFREFTRLLEGLDDLERTEHRLAQLARDHRKFGVKDKHYRPFFDAVVAMAEHISGPVVDQSVGRCLARRHRLVRRRDGSGCCRGRQSPARVVDRGDRPA